MKKQLLMLALIAFQVHAKVTHIHSISEFNALIAGAHAVIKFGAEWCGPCKSSISHFEALSNEAEFATVKFLSVDVDAQESLANKYHIQSLPTFLYLKNGTEVARTTGMIKRDEMKKIIRSKFDLTEQKVQKVEAKTASKPALQETAPVSTIKQSWWQNSISSIKNAFSWMGTKIRSLFHRN